MKGRPARLVARKRLKRENFTPGNSDKGYQTTNKSEFCYFHVVIVTHLWYFVPRLGEYLLLFLSLTCPPGSRIWPFFSQVSCGSGSPWAWQVNVAAVPTGRATDCGGWLNSAGAERKRGADRSEWETEGIKAETNRRRARPS